MIPSDTRTRSYVLMVQLLDKVANRPNPRLVAKLLGEAPPHCLSLLAKDGWCSAPSLHHITTHLIASTWSALIISGVWVHHTRHVHVRSNGPLHAQPHTPVCLNPMHVAVRRALDLSPVISFCLPLQSIYCVPLRFNIIIFSRSSQCRALTLGSRGGQLPSALRLFLLLFYCFGRALL